MKQINKYPVFLYLEQGRELFPFQITGKRYHIIQRRGLCHFLTRFVLQIQNVLAHGVDGVMHHVGYPDAAVEVVSCQAALAVDAKLQTSQPTLPLWPHLGDQGLYLLVQQRVESLRLGQRPVLREFR